MNKVNRFSLIAFFALIIIGNLIVFQPWHFFTDRSSWHSNLSQINYEKNNLISSIDHARLARSYDPGSFKAYRLELMSLKNLGKLDQAKQLLSEVHDLRPNENVFSIYRFDSQEMYLEQMGFISILEGNMDSAEKYFSQCIMDFPSYPASYLGMGIIAIRDDRNDDAIGSLNHAGSVLGSFYIDENRENEMGAVIDAYLAVAYSAKGEFEISEQHRKKAERVFPEIMDSIAPYLTT